MASLYDHNFELLPRPPPSAFSLGNPADRCVLPNFDNVAQLSDFVERLFVYRFAVPHTFAQLKAGAGFSCLLLLFVALVLARRLYERSFWVFRLQKIATGHVLVPNTMVVIIVISGAFSVILIAFLWEICSFYETHDKTPMNLILWLSLPWLALSLRTFSAAWGLFFATPERYQPSFGMHKGARLRRFFGHAYTINTLVVLYPVVFCASVASPAIVANVKYESAHHRQKEWLATYANSTDFTQAMVRDAQRVWYDEVAAMEIAAIMFVVWFLFIWIVMAMYFAVALRLMLAIRRQLKKQKESAVNFGIIATSRFVVCRDDDDDDDNNFGSREREREAMRKVDAMLARLTRQRDQERNGQGSGAVDNNNIDDDDEDDDRIAMDNVYDAVGGEEVDPTKQSVSSPPSTQQARQQSTQRWRRLMPNPALASDASRTVQSASPSVRLTQFQELQKAYKYLFAQSLTIVLGSVLFAINAVFLFVNFRSSLERPTADGGTRFEFWLPVSLLWLNWVSVLFGGGTIVSITQRTYEPVFSFGQMVATASQNDDQEQSPSSGMPSSTRENDESSELPPLSPPQSTAARRAAEQRFALQQLESGIVFPANAASA